MVPEAQVDILPNANTSTFPLLQQERRKMESRQVHAFGHGEIRRWLPGDFSFPYEEKRKKNWRWGFGSYFYLFI